MRLKRKRLTKEVIHYLFRRFHIMLLNMGRFLSLIVTNTGGVA